jgi:hypothetical protein
MQLIDGPFSVYAASPHLARTGVSRKAKARSRQFGDAGESEVTLSRALTRHDQGGVGTLEPKSGSGRCARIPSSPYFLQC